MGLTRSLEYLRFRLIGTRFERPARILRGLNTRRKLLRTPELAECLTEDEVIESLIRAHITDGMNCIDVGAHLGSMLSKFDQLSPSGLHTAFEPLGYKANWVQERFPKHRVHPLAISDEAGVVDFFFQPRSSAYSGIRLHESEVNFAADHQRLVVPVCRLDDVIPAFRPISFLKVDVEGAEMKVFEGAANLIRRDRPMILFECARSALKSFELEPTHAFDQLNGFGYDIYAPNDFKNGLPALSRTAFDAATRYPYRAFNFFALPRETNAAQLLAA